MEKQKEQRQEKKLVVSTWGLNEDVLKETVFEPFAKEHGVEIVLDIGNNSERLTKIKIILTHK